MCHAATLRPTSLQGSLKDATKGILQHGRSGRWGEVLAAWELCRCTSNLEPDIRVCNAAVAGCARPGSWQQAVELLDEAETLYLKTDAVTLASLLRGWREGREWGKAFAVFEEAAGSGIPADAIFFANVLASCSAAGRWSDAFELLRVLKHEGFYDQLHCNSAVASCDVRNLWDRAIALLSLKRQDGLQADVIALNSAISTCANKEEGRGGVWEHALLLLHGITALGIDPDIISFNAAMSACAREEPELVLLLLRQPGFLVDDCNQML